MKRSTQLLTWLLILTILLTHVLPVRAQDAPAAATDKATFLPLVMGAAGASELDASTVATAPGAFNKNSPANGAQNISTPVTLSWGTAAGATQYGYCVASTNACPGSDLGYTRLSGTSVTLNLQPATTYYWQVRAYNGANEMTPANGVSGWFSFTTSPLPGAFNKMAPTNDSANLPTTLTLQWASTIGAVDYGYCVNTTNACPNGDAGYTHLGGNSATVTLQPGTTYYWQVRAYNDSGYTPANGVSAWHRFTTAAPPSVTFNKVAPGNGATNLATTVTLSWQPLATAVGYGYCIDTTLDAICDRGVDNYLRVSGTTVSLQLDPGKRYQWQARAYLADGTFISGNGTSSWWNFETNPNGTSPFGKLAPSNGTTNLPRNSTLRWQSVPGAVGYGYCLDTTLNNSCDRGSDNYIRISSTTVAVALAANQSYEWQVRAYTADGQWTPANGVGQWWSFTTEGSELSGYLPGEFQVSEAGAATYRIPLALPSGTGGMTPQLALTYDSRGGNTISAWGWSLSGLSVINRCPTTLAQHNFIDGVDFDGNDQFCLDGQLLVAIQGVYGADQTVYRTENESFSKVVSYGQGGNGPAGFKVWTKAGLIMEYGLTDNSRLDAQGRTDILYWAVGKIQDTKGNYLLFDYDKNVAAGELNPLRIRYTGNSAQQLAPYASVEFIYENRPDGRVQYIGGSTITLAKRLQYLRTYIDGALVREVRLGYETSPTTGRSRLINLTECGWDGQCLLATRFKWSSTTAEELNFNGTGSGEWQGHAGGSTNNAVGDFNGDGRTDLAGYTGISGRWHVCLSTGSNFTCDYWIAHAGGVGNNVTADFNGDGLADLAGYTGDAGRWHVCLANGSGFNCSYWVGHSGGVRNNVLADFNGDSLTDMAGYTGSNGLWHVCLSTGSGFSCNYWTAHAGGVNNNVAGDFNGDGLTDLIGYTGSGWQWHLCLSTGSSFSCAYVTAHAGGATNNAAADFNGDGLTDLAGYTGSNGSWHVCLATGVSFACSYWTGHAGGANNNVMADYNGDGLVDLAGYTGANNVWHVCLSTGLGWNCGRYWTGHGGGSANNATGDYNGDGKSDLAGYMGSNGRWHVVLAAGVAPDQLQQIINGHGAQVNITYAPLTNPAVYIKASGAIYPQREFIAPMYVVQEYNTSNGLGGLQRMAYRYEGLRINLRGRGFLGFAAVKATDLTTNIATHTYYHQAHPYKSLVRKVEQFQPNGQLLQRVENSWAVKNFTGGVQAASLSEAAARGYYMATDEAMSLPVYAMITPTVATVVLTETAATAGDGANGLVKPSTDLTLPTVHMYLPLISSTGSIAQGDGAEPDTSTPNFPSQDGEYDFTTFIDTGAIAKDGINQQPTVDPALINREVATNEREALTTTADALGLIVAANTQGVTYFPYLSQSTVQKFELNGTLIYSTTTRSDYDSYGNPTTLAENTSDGYSKRTVNVYTNNTARWLLGRLTSAKVTAQVLNQAAQTRSTAFSYDPTSGLLTREESEPNSALIHVKTYTYDGFGNIIASTVSGPELVARTQSTEFDSRGRLLIKSTNALGHSETRGYDQRLGLPTTITDPNGLTVNRSYDSFGRLLQESRPDGVTSKFTYRLCRPGNCPANVAYYLRTERSGAASTVDYFDLLDRTVRTESVGFNGQAVYVDTVYNARGQLQKVSAPYFSGSTPLWTTYTYDLLGRATSELEPNQAKSTVVYAGLVTRATNALGQITSRTVNSQGWLLRSVDAASSVIVYSYDSFGNLLTLVDPAGNTTTMQYDLRGRKVSLRDPDTGLTQYRYNAADELIWQKDAKSQEITLIYDNLGRLTERSEGEGISRWVYDTGTKGIGKVAEISGPNGYKERYTYDALGRLAQTTYTIDGQSFTMRQNYDAYSRVDLLTYPTGFALRHLYNTYGYLSEVRNHANNLPFWQATTANARGQLEGESFRNGIKTERLFDPKSGFLQSIKSGPATDLTRVQNLAYSFDLLGNLTGRTDNRQGLTELFKYDGLNRLTSAQVNTRAAQTVQYDRLGNITFKSDVGTYRYGENGAGPHAVTSIANGVSASFTYDANGNRITSNAGTVTYASFNLPTSINHNNRIVTFAYGPDHTRYKETIQVSGVTTTTLFAGGRYERVTVGSRTVHKHFITGSNGVVAIYYHQPAGPTDYVHYLHRDHLGSIDTITDSAGNVVERLSYDPWGKRRTADWQNVNSAITSVVRRGYTGHEQLDEVGLIHMNGRVYDPAIGRFLSADPAIQAPELTQNLNRYSYVMNNPLAATDPSGFNWFSDLWDEVEDFFEENWKPILTVAVTLAVAWWASGFVSPIWSSAIGNFAGNVTGTLINGGGIPQALQAGLRGAAKGFLQPYDVSGMFSSMIDNAQLLGNSFLEGAWSITKYVGGTYMNSLITNQVIQPLANKIGLSVDDFNLILTGLSWAGDAITGYTDGRLSSDWRDPDTGEGNLLGFQGIGNRQKSIGGFSFVFDAVDIALSYQGLLTATAWKYYNNYGYTQLVRGHSEGSLDATNLVRRGLAGSAKAYALPFGNITPTSVAVNIGDLDLVNGGILGWYFNPGATIKNVPFAQHARGYYGVISTP